jgi:hypothetical protein
MFGTKGLLLAIILYFTYSSYCITTLKDSNHVSNFKLKDYNGKEHSLSDYTNSNAIVLMFISTQCPVYIVDEKSSEKVIDFLNPDWSGAIPVTIIYDKKNKRQKFLLGAQSYFQLKNSIDSVRSLY